MAMTPLPPTIAAIPSPPGRDGSVCIRVGQGGVEPVRSGCGPGRNRAIRPGAIALTVLLALGLFGTADALYTSEAITAFRVPDGTLQVDGTPEILWRALSIRSGAVSTISFKDYGKLVLLQPQAVRNADPSLYVTKPVDGSISMLAAYDNAALYFLFLAKTASVVDPKKVCPDGDGIWKADAPEVYLDPNLWTDDSVSYRNYFSADAGGLIFGTSPKTIQLAKPLSQADTRTYYRNRATSDKFQTAVPPSGVSAVSKRHSASDTALVVVEMKIPYWGGLSASNLQSNPMFISWGFNMYPDSLWASCDGNPLAYRWAKHYKNYDQAPEQPPGWLAKDSTHYDPTRSWDGWGRFRFDGNGAVDSNRCQSTLPSDWDLQAWQKSCQAATALSANPVADLTAKTGRGNRLEWNAIPTGEDNPVRDLRGRALGRDRIPRLMPRFPAVPDAVPPRL